MAKNTEAYKLFLTQAKDAGLLNEFSAEDLQLAANSPDFGTALLSLKQDYHKATTDEMKTLAHESANQLREKYRTMGSTGSAYGNSGYKQTLDALAGRSYDAWKQGDSYKALEKNYTAAGQKAMQDTLAQLSARTGGLASSYAGQAGQQVYSDYLNEMENAAYNRYQAENAELYNLLDAQRSAEATEYARLLDRISMGQQAEETEYKRSQAAEQQSYERGLLEREEARDTVDNMIAMGASLSQIPADLLEKSGYSSGYVNAGNADYWRKNTPKAGGGVEEQKVYEPYTPKQEDTYNQILQSLMTKAEADGSYEPLNYIRRVEKSFGEDYYKNMIGNTLYERLLQEADKYSYGKREKPEDAKEENMGAIYAAAMASDDWEAWLVENGQWLTDEEVAAVIKFFSE
jgi:hypothetical protein